MKKSYALACATNGQCDDGKGLTCPATSSNCNCPTTSLANMCDCSSSINRFILFKTDSLFYILPLDVSSSFSLVLGFRLIEMWYLK